MCLVHDYLDIDPEEIWNIVQLDVPVLKRQMQTLLQRLARYNNRLFSA